MMERSEAVTYRNVAQGGAQCDETENDPDAYNVYAEIAQLQPPTTGHTYLELQSAAGQHATHAPADTDDTDYLEPIRHGQHDTPTAIPSPYSTKQAPGIQDPAEHPAPTGQRTWTTAFAKRWKLCALLLIFVGLGLGFGAGVIYARSTLDRKDYRGVNHCASSPCQNGGDCFPGFESFLCNCTSAFTGAYCQTDTNECSPNPCYNGGSCTDGINSYQCACAAGYTGVHCEINTNEFSSSPCRNGGSCFDGNSSYQCTCAVGYTGVHCEINTNECSPNPCYNGGSCTGGINSYQCTCAARYTGVHCEISVDECASNPCPTGTVCSDGVGAYTCICDRSIVTHRDCNEVRTAMCSVSGVYTVTPWGGTPTPVYCDMDTTGGGWLVFQKRVDGSVDFYRNWASYAVGFGDLNGEFWLGNRNLHLLTAQKSYTLRVVISDWEGNQRYAQYGSFTIGSEQDKFRLRLGAYSGNAGDSLSDTSGDQFSTRDQDNDGWSSGHCAQTRRGAWWYGSCSQSNLNGRYYPAGPYTRAQSQTGSYDGVRWDGWKGDLYSLKSTRMMLRPAS